jgi:hypothetical protein
MHSPYVSVTVDYKDTRYFCHGDLRQIRLDTSIYAAFRPTCPRSLFDFIFRYHERNKGARWDRAVDLGCGTG